MKSELKPAISFQGSPRPDPVNKQACRIALTTALNVIGMPFSAICAPMRLYSHLKNRPAIEQLAYNRFDAVSNAVDLETTISPRITKIQQLLSKKPKGSMEDHMQIVRRRVDRALGEKVTDKEAQFLHAAAHAFVSSANGMDVYKKAGESVHKEDDAFPYENLANTLDRAVKKKPVFEKDTVIGKIFWTFAHPEKAANSFFDHSGLSHPLKYNSFNHGNANVRIGMFEIGKKKIHMILGPTPTSDRLFLAHLEYLKANGGVHSQHTLESPWQKGENARREEQSLIAEQYKDQLVYTFGHIENREVNPTLGEEGVSLPKSFDNDQRQGLEQLGKEMFGGLSLKAQRLGLQTLVAIQGMCNLPDGEHTMSQACKQDIDRGVLVNVLTILFMDQLAGNLLTEERIDEIVGIVLLRAGLVDDRAILQKRYDALSEVLHHFAKDPTKLQLLNSHFQPWGVISKTKFKGLGA